MLFQEVMVPLAIAALGAYSFWLGWSQRRPVPGRTPPLIPTEMVGLALIRLFWGVEASRRRREELQKPESLHQTGGMLIVIGVVFMLLGTVWFVTILMGPP